MSGEIPGTFGKSAVGHHHGTVSIIVGDGTNRFLNGSNSDIFFISFGLNNDFLPPFFYDQIRSVIVAALGESDPVTKMTKLDS